MTSPFIPEHGVVSGSPLNPNKPKVSDEVCYNDGAPHPRTECHMDRCGLDPAHPVEPGPAGAARDAALFLWGPEADAASRPPGDYHAVWSAVYEAVTTAGLQPSRVADKATAAILAMASRDATVPVPTREEIAEALHSRSCSHQWRDKRYCPDTCSGHWLPDADAVLALFGGDAK